MLSSNTKYGAYLLLKISERAYGLDLMPALISLQLGNNNNDDDESNSNICEAYVWLHHKSDEKKQDLEYLFYGNRRERARKLALISNDNLENYKEIRALRERQDGWLEIELGEFFSGESDEEVNMSFMETKGFQLKSGLVIQGIQIRPKY